LPASPQPICEKDKVTFSNEDTITDMDDFFKTKAGAKNEVDLFTNRFRCDSLGDTLVIDNTPQRINMSALDSFYRLANSQVKCANFLTGIRITLGMQNNAIVFLYQPVYMHDTGTYRQENSYYVFDLDPKTYYTYDPAKFLFVKYNGDAAALCKNYYTNIRIIHTQDATLETFNQDFSGRQSWKNDTKSIIFSFQEIFRLYHDNTNETDGQRYCKNIYIRNGAANYRKGKLNQWRIKHTVLFSIDNGSLNSFLSLPQITEVGRFANLAHLCPPSCESLNYYTTLR
jgi:hypothetical protein